ncbi:hypothetical protein J6590_072112 [Homalodisca vitripennis]|nr:hypothetical protein J6590_072112 [Homalodisca vitripennis]
MSILGKDDTDKRCGFIAPNLIPPTAKKSSFRCCDIRRDKFRYCAMIHRAVGGESNLAPHPATDDPPLQQGEQSTAQGEATRDRQSVYSHKGRRPCVWRAAVVDYN